MLTLVSNETQEDSEGSYSNIWEDSNTGNWRADNNTGHARADELVKSIRAGEAPAILGHTVRAIIEVDAWGGVEVGFFHRIADHLRSI